LNLKVRGHGYSAFDDFSLEFIVVGLDYSLCLEPLLAHSLGPLVLVAVFSMRGPFWDVVVEVKVLELLHKVKR